MTKSKKSNAIKKKRKTPQARTVTGKADMLKALEQSLGIVTTACKAVGIERKTHYLWLEADPEYAAAVAAIQEQAIDYVEHQLFKLVQNMETAAIIFYLKTKGKARGYVERVQTQEVKPGPFVIETDRSDTVTTT